MQATEIGSEISAWNAPLDVVPATEQETQQTLGMTKGWWTPRSRVPATLSAPPPSPREPRQLPLPCTHRQRAIDNGADGSLQHARLEVAVFVPRQAERIDNGVSRAPRT